jgi:hypothetical protein
MSNARTPALISAKWPPSVLVVTTETTAQHPSSHDFVDQEHHHYFTWALLFDSRPEYSSDQSASFQPSQCALGLVLPSHAQLVLSHCFLHLPTSPWLRLQLRSTGSGRSKTFDSRWIPDTLPLQRSRVQHWPGCLLGDPCDQCPTSRDCDCRHSCSHYYRRRSARDREL